MVRCSAAKGAATANQIGEGVNMRAWLYYRLSRDEDEAMNPLQNQRQILIHYAEQNGIEGVGESYDDNVSGMTFERVGLNQLEDAVMDSKIDVVLVKDLSRLGRHRTQTALFIDHLRENNVKVYSVTEGIDSAGYGLHTIARGLNDRGVKYPEYFAHRKSRSTQTVLSKKFLWVQTSVKRILENECYTGTLVNHKDDLLKNLQNETSCSRG